MICPKSVLFGQDRGERTMGLLELILQKSEQQYISDLNNGICKENVKKAVKEIPYKQYDMKEWKEAVYYLTGGKVLLDTEDEIIDYLNEI